MDSCMGGIINGNGGDRLSSLPDDIIHKILSSFNIRYVIENFSVLSSRWRFIWTTMPYLNFSSTQDFSKLPKFSNFVTHVLSRRNSLTDVYSMSLTFHGKLTQRFVKRLLNYAFSHNLHQLNLVYLAKKDMEFPLLSLFTSHSPPPPPLKHLTLTMQVDLPGCVYYRCLLTSTPELPTLTTLDLHDVTLCDDDDYDEADNKYVGLFLKCPNLKNLTLKHFSTTGSSSNGFTIFHPRLSNLTLENCLPSVKVVNVAAPQLENLTITICYASYVVSAPRLASLVYVGLSPLRLSTEDGFHSLEKADICFSSPLHTQAYQILSLLQQLYNVRFLKLNLEITELLSSSVELLLHRPSPFVNLKSLKIYPFKKFWFKQAPREVAMSPELKSYLLDSSPKSTFTMFLREEIVAQRIMAELGVILEKEKDNSKTNRSHLERGKAHVAESYKPKKLKVGDPLENIKSCLENLGVQNERKNEKACVIILKLQAIEASLARLPASNRAKIEPCFNSLCAEAGIAIGEITDCLKIQLLCDENQVQSRSSVDFHELATALGLSC